jgi:hypothetical protein
MSTSEAESAKLKALLEAEVSRFRGLYPASDIRFAEAIGKRVSHVAGSLSTLHLQERRIAVNDTVLMFVDDRDGIAAEDLEQFTVQVAALLGDVEGP